MAVSLQRGLVCHSMTEQNVNAEIFVEFLEMIKVVGGRSYVLLDNLSVHKAHRTREQLAQMNFEPIYSVQYCPILKGIENVFGLLK